MLENARHIHFVGIGGIGMSALALLLKQQGRSVSGSDQQDSVLLETLRQAGIQIHIGHAATHARGADLVVYSSAVKSDNPERSYAEEHAIPEIRRAELLGEITQRYTHTVAIAGTHGKTTTTGLCGQILIEAGADPAILVGGILPGLQSNLRLGGLEHIVVEADEYDRSFLALDPDRILVTTLEADHLDIYRDLQDVRDTFLQFVSKLDDRGILVLQGDHEELRLLAARSPRTASTYGLTEQVDYRATDLVLESFSSSFTIFKHGLKLGRVHLHMPGQHNVMNALGACALTHEMGVPFPAIRTGLEKFRGVERRFQLRGNLGSIQFIDDYAHHPSELEATLQAARSGWPKARIVAIFQPHLYSRTRDFAREFAAALTLADLAILTDIYPARELPIPGVSSDLIMAHSDGSLRHLATLADVYAYLKPRLQEHDLVITMGAGDIWKLHDLFLGAGK